VLPVDQKLQPEVFNNSRLSTVNTIAVMPLVNLNQDPDQDYVSDGMTDDLIAYLSKILSLSVIVRNSVFKKLQYLIPCKDQSIRDRLFKGLEMAAQH